MMPGYPGQPQPGSQDYDFGTLYGMADHSTGFLYPEAWFDAVVEHAEYGRSKDGTKGQWTVKFRTTTGENAGRAPITTTLSISPKKNDGTDNAQGLGILFRQLAALGVPVPDPADPAKTLNGPAPFWVQRMPYEQVAQMMIGRPALVKNVHDDYDGVTRNKIRDIRPPRDGAPTTWPQAQQQAAQNGFAAPAGYGQPQQPANPYANPYAPQGPAQPPFSQGGQWQPQQPAYDPSQAYQNTGPGYQQPQQPGYGQPPQAYQNVQAGPPMQPQAAPQGQAPAMPGVPPWAQPATPGQPGTGQFTAQGQAVQPGTNPGQQAGPPAVPQPPWQQPQNPQDPQQGGPGQPPPPWMQ